jgi:hypothetical protein
MLAPLDRRYSRFARGLSSRCARPASLALVASLLPLTPRTHPLQIHRLPRTTCPILPVTARIVTAVSTLLATASILELSLNRFNASFCFLIAFAA